MFSQLGPLFRTELRQAEAANTRLEIKREDKGNQERGDDGFDDEVDTSALWEDKTEVSIDALRAFLLGFLTSRGLAQEQINPAETSLAPVADYRPPANAIAARAVRAYGAHAESPSLPYPAEEPATAQAEERQQPADLSLLLQADELRTMHVLIAELDALSRRGVQVLVIEKADSFLASLVAAVALEKSRA